MTYLMDNKPFCHLKDKSLFDLRSIIDNVCDDFDEYIITAKDKKSAVLISYE